MDIWIKLELELIQTQMTQKPMLRAEVYTHAMRASQNRKEPDLGFFSFTTPDKDIGSNGRKLRKRNMHETHLAQGQVSCTWAICDR